MNLIRLAGSRTGFLFSARGTPTARAEDSNMCVAFILTAASVVGAKGREPPASPSRWRTVSPASDNASLLACSKREQRPGAPGVFRARARAFTSGLDAGIDKWSFARHGYYAQRPACCSGCTEKLESRNRLACVRRDHSDPFKRLENPERRAYGLKTFNGFKVESNSPIMMPNFFLYQSPVRWLQPRVRRGCSIAHRFLDSPLSKLEPVPHVQVGDG